MKYRVIHFRIMVRATDIDDTTIALGQALRPFGRVRITADGPYYKDNELLEFNVKLEPPGDVDECVATLQATAPSGWSGSPVGPAWVKAGPGMSFLLPQVDWATLSPEEAHELPQYAFGDIVRILDCPTARREGLVGVEAEVCGRAAPLNDEPWNYAVRPASWATLISFDEPDVILTGRRAPADTSKSQVISVNPDGEVTGWS